MILIVFDVFQREQLDIASDDEFEDREDEKPTVVVPEDVNVPENEVTTFIENLSMWYISVIYALYRKLITYLLTLYRKDQKR